MKDTYVPVSDGIFYNNEVYFYISITNSIYKISLIDNKISFFAEVPFGKKDKEFQYETMLVYKNYLVFVPFAEKNLVLCDLNTKEFSKIVVPLENNEMAGYMAAVVYKDKIIMCGTNKPIITCVDMINHSVKAIKDFVENDNYKKINDDVYFRQQILMVESSIYIPFCNADAFIVVNGESLEYKIIRLGDGLSGYSAINKIENRIWFAPRTAEGEMVSFDIKNGNICRYGIKGLKEANGFIGIISREKSLYLYSGINTTNTSIKKGEIKIVGGDYRFAHQVGEDVIAFSRDRNTMDITRENINYSIKIKIDYKEKNYDLSNKRGEIIENRLLNVRDFINAIVQE